VFLFSRSGGRDFTQRDCAVLDALRPLLHERWELARERRRLADVLRLVEGDERAFVVLDGPTRWALANEPAQALLDRLGCGDGELPGALIAWLDAGAGGVVRVSAGGVTVGVQRVGESLLLEELGPASVLTRREREILELVAQGRTNGQIAEQLWISGGTVRRHLENAYAKLGVHTRTAAVRAVLRDR
jgi:DNA-binding CsgD family transcriptional regulator